MEREELSDDQLLKMVEYELSRLGQEPRNQLAKRKPGIEKYIAHMVVTLMRRRGVRADVPVRDPHAAIVGRAYPEG